MVYESYSLCELRIIRGNTESFAREDEKHDRDIRLAPTQTSAISEHANEKGHLPIWDEIVTLTGTHEGSRKLPILDFIQTTFLKHGHLQSKSATAGLLRNGPMREQRHKVGIIMRIEMHQLQRTIVLHHRLMNTSSIAVETSRSSSQSDSIVRQTSKIHLCYLTPR